ncbi:MAG: hypothetical protein FJ118_15090 [Deltaproteobacteria bacterium]|nr:hypothetical protein [Deltaproteobacteria bacterium]
MGMFRDTDVQEADIVKEMAEALGSTGLRLEEILEKLDRLAAQVKPLIAMRRHGLRGPESLDSDTINESIREYNILVDKAEDARRWLLIQREACGFRIHRDVDRYYPIPTRLKLIKS